MTFPSSVGPLSDPLQLQGSLKLTVLIITYNHEPFIATAVDSVLMQETDFDYEIIISEDCSTDQTRAIVSRYAHDYPKQVRLLLSDRNLNDNSVVRRGLEAARGQYVALLDGDDYWTTPTKLQKQIDFLDTHPDVSISFHNVNVDYEDSDEAGHPFHTAAPGRVAAVRPAPISALADIVRADFIPTCSAVLRNVPGRNLPAWYDSSPAGDWSLFVLYAEHGNIAFHDEIMATYRIHAGGFWSSAWSHYRSPADVERVAEIYDLHNRYLGYRLDSLVRTGTADLYEHAAHLYYSSGRAGWARMYAARALKRSPASQLARRWKLLAVLTLGKRRSLPRRRRRLRA